jgi:hypothetical protein
MESSLQKDVYPRTRPLGFSNKLMLIGKMTSTIASCLKDMVRTWPELLAIKMEESFHLYGSRKNL